MATTQKFYFLTLVSYSTSIFASFLGRYEDERRQAEINAEKE